MTKSLNISPKSKDRSRYLWLSFISLGIVLGLWVLLTRSSANHPPIVAPLKLPPPEDVVASLLRLGDSAFTFSVSTLRRVIVGMVIGASLGVIAGLAISASKPLDYLLSPLISAIRPVPVVALTPWAILWIGLGEASQVFLVALGAFLVLVTSTHSLAGNVPARLIDAARSLGARGAFLNLAVVLPLIFPSLLAALRVAAASSFGVAIAAEYLGAQGGLGFMIRNARQTLSTDAILLGIILIGLEAALIDNILRAWARRYSIWQDSTSIVHREE